jgi:hypothetical protein
VSNTGEQARIHGGGIDTLPQHTIEGKSSIL